MNSNNLTNNIDSTATELKKTVLERVSSGKIDKNDPKVLSNNKLIAILEQSSTTIKTLEKQLVAVNGSEVKRLGGGKVPPQAVELEQAIIGAMMLEDGAFGLALDLIRSPYVFYKPAHQEIFKAIQNIADREDGVDLLTVIQQCRKNGVIDKIGGAQYISELTSKVASSNNILTHIRIIQEKYILRKLIELGGNILKNAYEETLDVFDFLETIVFGLIEITEYIEHERPK